MGYKLTAFLVRSHAAWPTALQHRAGPFVRLYADSEGSLVLVPILEPTIRRQEKREASEDSDPVTAGFLELRESTVVLGIEASRFGRLAYVHAEFIGGPGIQASIGWQDGAVAFGPDLTASNVVEASDAKTDTGADYDVVLPPDEMAIGHALDFLGVKQDPSAFDLFDTVGLGRHRFTRRWLEDAAAADQA